MLTLYRNFTVTVQHSATPYLPNNDLQLYLYEGRLELKQNPSTSKKDVYNYGTSVPATPVYTKDGVVATALAADATNRPGEYDFVALDLNKSGSLSYSGQTLYSVIAKLATDVDFEHARVIIENTDISDPNAKQIIKSAIGGTSTLVDNVAFAGGTVQFERATDAASSDTEQYLSIINLPDAMTAMTVSVDAPHYPSYSDGLRLLARFNAQYTSADGKVVIVWDGVPAFHSITGKWVIKLTNDQYNHYRTSEFGPSLQLSSIWDQFVVTVNTLENNVMIRRFDTIPTSVLSGDDREKPIITSYITGSDRVVGIGDWSYADAASTPEHDLDVKGNVGFRVQTAGNTAFHSTITSTFIKGGNAFQLSLTANASTLSDGTYLRLTCQNSFTAIGHKFTDHDTDLVVDFTSTAITVRGSATTYLETTPTTVTLYVKNSAGTAVTALFATSVALSIGYDMYSTANYIRFNTTSCSIFRSGNYVLNVDGTSSYFTYSTAGSPILRINATDLTVEGSATTYLKFTTANAITGFWDYTGTKKFLSVGESTDPGVVAIGYDLGSTTYISGFIANNSDTWIMNGGKLGLLMSESLTCLQAPAGTPSTLIKYPNVLCSDSDIKIQGSATAYVSVSSSDIKLQESATSYVTLSSSVFSVYASVGSVAKPAVYITGSSSKFGYDVLTTNNSFETTATAAYIKIGGVSALSTDSSTIYINAGGVPVLSADGSTTLLQQGTTYPKIQLTTSVASMDYSATNYIRIASGSINVTIPGAAIYIANANITLDVGAALSVPSPTPAVYSSPLVGVYRHTQATWGSYAFLKIPFYATSQSPFGYPVSGTIATGAMCVEGSVSGDTRLLVYFGALGWKRVLLS